MANPLNPLRFPLYGERLIEASAGTGKTYTIAGLYLRLLLGHGPVIEQAGKWQQWLQLFLGTCRIERKKSQVWRFSVNP
jgi:ATP-dependent exoDNAse (exonuclease V) beta subunit